MNHYFTNNENLKSEFRKITYKYQDYNFSYLSDNGVFSKDKIDFGSKLLVETFLKYNSSVENILDLGCGYGFIGITLSKVLNVPVTLCDVNPRAVHLSEKNIKEHKVDAIALLSDGYENIRDKYDVIITNPPIRVGKEKLLSLLNNAKNYLNDFGSLWFVIRKDQGAKSIIKALEKNYTCEIIEKSKGFYIIKAS